MGVGVDVDVDTSIAAKRSETIVGGGGGLAQFTFLVFSDDIAWCKDQSLFSRLPCVRFVEVYSGGGGGGGKEATRPGSLSLREAEMRRFAWVDLYTMAQASHFLLANSTFSWWG